MEKTVFNVDDTDFVRRQMETSDALLALRSGFVKQLTGFSVGAGFQVVGQDIASTAAQTLVSLLIAAIEDFGIASESIIGENKV